MIVSSNLAVDSMKAKKVLKKKIRPATVDPKYIRVPNICFSLTDKNDKREKKYKKERLKYGFDPSECWSLYSTIAKFIYPRLKFFRDNLSGTPIFNYDNGIPIEEGMKQWEEILDKMLYSFDMIAYKDDTCKYDEIYYKLKSKKEREKIDKKIQEGLGLFAKWFQSLWN